MTLVVFILKKIGVGYDLEDDMVHPSIGDANHTLGDCGTIVGINVGTKVGTNVGSIRKVGSISGHQSAHHTWAPLWAP